MPSNGAKYRYIVIGAGIVGLATAAELNKRFPDAPILVIDKETGPAKHQSGRNSGVVHAGVYYTPGSLKARLCAKGVGATMAFCRENDVAMEQCGKLIVATNDTQEQALGALHVRATENGIPIQRIGQAELAELEPAISGKAALLSPTTGIADYAGICHKLVQKLTDRGGEFVFSATVTGLVERADGIVAETSCGSFQADKLVACCGLQSDRIADLMGLADDFRIIPFRGEYYRLAPALNQIVNHLIYPLPEPGLPFLGVHLTRMAGGYVTVGPNAVLSLARESYGNRLPDAADLWRTVAFPGFWKLAARFAGAGLEEMKRTVWKAAYLKECRKYCPSLQISDLHPYRPGIRAMAVDRTGAMLDDFLIRRTARSVHVCNAPSPAATSAFAIAETVVDTVAD